MLEIKLNVIQTTLEDQKAENIVTFDVSDRSPFFNYFIVATARSERHLHALAEHIEEELAKSQIEIKGIDGKNSSHWIIVDCGDVLVHLFDEEERKRIDFNSLLNGKPNEKED